MRSRVVIVVLMGILVVTGQATEITTILGEWQGTWQARVGSYVADEAVSFRFYDAGRCSYGMTSSSGWIDGVYAVQGGEIVIQLGSSPEDFVALRNIRRNRDSLQFDVALPTLDPRLQETNVVSLSRLDSAMLPSPLPNPYASNVMTLLRKHAVLRPLPVRIASISDADRAAIKVLLQEHILNVLRSDNSFLNFHGRELDVAVFSNRVQVTAAGKPGIEKHDLRYNSLLRSNVLMACNQILDPNDVRVEIDVRGLEAFSMFSSLGLKRKYVDGTRVKKALLWQDCLTLARQCCNANFDESTFSTSTSSHFKISTGLKPVSSDTPGIVVVERLTLNLKPLTLELESAPESVSLGVLYEQFRRHAASRVWHKIAHHRERMLQSVAKSQQSSSRLDVDEVVLENIVRNVSTNTKE